MALRATTTAKMAAKRVDSHWIAKPESSYEIDSSSDLKRLKFFKTNSVSGKGFLQNSYLQGVAYAKAVLAGEIVTNDLIKASCERFLGMLAVAGKKDCKFVFLPDKIDHFLKIVALHRFVQTMDGQIILAPWQVFIACNIYGFWMASDNSRRWTTEVHIFVARKAGKTTFCALIALYEILFGENGLEAYITAYEEKQARILYNIAKELAKAAYPQVHKNYYITDERVANFEKRNQFITSLSKNSSVSGDGLNPALNLFDEAAIIEDSNSFTILQEAMVSRKNPLTIYLTTANYSTTTYYFKLLREVEAKTESRDWSELDRRVAFIYRIEADDKTEDSSCWVKANPMIGHTIDLEKLETDYNRAKNEPSELLKFEVKYLNRWRSHALSWLDVNDWSDPRNIIENEEALFNSATPRCAWAGMDIGITDDMNALCILFDFNEFHYAKFMCWITREKYENSSNLNKRYYDLAIRQGSLRIMEGRVANPQDVVDKYLKLIKPAPFLIEYDRVKSGDMVNQMEKAGFRLNPTTMATHRFYAPMQESAARIKKGFIKHLNDGFVSWQLENTKVKPIKSEYLSIDSSNTANEKNDAIMALILAVSASMNAPYEVG